MRFLMCCHSSMLMVSNRLFKEILNVDYEVYMLSHLRIHWRIGKLLQMLQPPIALVSLLQGSASARRSLQTNEQVLTNSNFSNYTYLMSTPQPLYPYIRGREGRKENLNHSVSYTCIDCVKVLEQNCLRSKGRFCI